MTAIVSMAINASSQSVRPQDASPTFLTVDQLLPSVRDDELYPPAFMTRRNDAMPIARVTVSLLRYPSYRVHDIVTEVKIWDSARRHIS